MFAATIIVGDYNKVVCSKNMVRITYEYTLPGQKYLNILKFVSQVAHDRYTYTTKNKSP